jgi:hypothetical protein
MNYLQARLGYAGYALDNYQNALMWNVTNGAAIQGPSVFWFADSFRMPPGSSLWWDTQFGWVQHSPSGGGAKGDRLGLFYVTQPAGGNFILSISTNAGPWTTVATLNGYSPTPAGHYTNFDLPLNFYRLRVDDQTGTNIIIGTQTLDTHTNGLQAVFAYYGGIALSQVTNVPLSIRIPIFRALSPDLLIWHMKEPISPLQQDMMENEQWWSSAIPNCAVVYIGTPYDSADTNVATATTVDQNTIVRSIATNYSRTYMDCMTPSVSYDWLLTNGFMADGTHLNVQGNTYLANFMWNSLGFFALRVNRQIQLYSDNSLLYLNWPTTNGISYELQGSTNLTTWNPVYSVAGDGNAKTYTNQVANGAQFFRLRLTPN